MNNVVNLKKNVQQMVMVVYYEHHVKILIFNKHVLLIWKVINVYGLIINVWIMIVQVLLLHLQLN